MIQTMRWQANESGKLVGVEPHPNHGNVPKN